MFVFHYVIHKKFATMRARAMPKKRCCSGVLHSRDNDGSGPEARYIELEATN